MARRRKEQLSDDVIFDLETRLSGTLKPIQPPSEIVQRLRERIRFPTPEEIQMRLNDWRRMFLVFGGVMSGMLVIITIARAFFHLFGRRHM
ncbi:MAG TPA: hypothetical protein VK851_14210 [Anaerolineales bacterium]|nr:hypothetical protein [Anaerolineales bacterium]